VVVTLIGNVVAGVLAGRTAGLSPQASLNIGLTIVSRGEFSIIMANLGQAGNLLPVLQPFAALYVLLLAILGPLLTKGSDQIYAVWEGLSGRSDRAAPSPPGPLSHAVGEGEEERYRASREAGTAWAAGSPSPTAWERGPGGEGKTP